MRTIAVARLDLPLLRTKADFDHGRPPPGVRDAQAVLAWADHWVIVFPLWLGTAPALLKAFLEPCLRPGFAFDPAGHGTGRRRLRGTSARLAVTMGMPALRYRLFYRAHGVRSLQRGILRFAGIRPVPALMLGLVEGRGERARKAWLGKLERLGRRGR